MSDCWGRWKCIDCDNLNYPWENKCVVCGGIKPECENNKESK